MKLKKRIRAAACALLMAVSSVTSAMPAFANDDPLPEPRFGTQFFVMGNKTWNWQSVSGTLDDNGNFVISGNAAELADASRSDSDTAVGSSGFQLFLDNPSDYEIGTVIHANCRLTVENEGDAVFPEPIEQEMHISINDFNEGTYYIDNIELFGYGADWADLEKLGEFTVTAELSGIEVDTSNVDPEPQPGAGPIFESIFYVMGNDTWNWQAVSVSSNDNNTFVLNANAAELAAASRSESDTAVGDAGFQLFLDNPFDFAVGTVIRTKCRLTIENEGDAVFPEPIEQELDIAIDEHDINKYYNANLSLFPYNTDWAELEKLGEFTLTAEIYDIEVDTSDVQPEPEPNDGPRFGSQFYVMGDSDWIWKAKTGYLDSENTVSMTVDAPDLAARSRTENDKAVGLSGVQFWLDNPGDYRVGTVVNAKSRITFDFGDGETEPMVFENDVTFTVENHKADVYPVADIVIFPGGTEWEELERLGSFTYTGELYDIEVDASNSRPDAARFGGLFYVMGNDVWNWTASHDYFNDEYSIAIYDNAAALIERSKSETDTAIGDAGFQVWLDNPSEYTEDTVITANCHITVSSESGVYEYDSDFSFAAEDYYNNKDTFPAAGYSFFPNGTDWAELESWGDFTLTATLTDIQINEPHSGNNSGSEPEKHYCDGYEYVLSNGEATIVSGIQLGMWTGTIDSGSYIRFPKELDGYPVTDIKFEQSGSSHSQKTDILIIESDIPRLRRDMFQKFAPKEIIIRGNVQTIDGYTFDDENLEIITVPASVTEIGERAFGYHVEYGEDQYDYSYYYNPSFTLYCTEGSAAEKYAKNNGLNYYPSLDYQFRELEDGTLEVSRYTAAGSTNAEIPSEILGKHVTGVGICAFNNTNYNRGLVKSVTVPDGVTYIGQSAFIVCNALESVQLADSVTSIRPFAFYSCEGLNSINIPNNVTSIGEKAFWDCKNLKSLTIPNSVTEFGKYAVGFGYDEDYNTAVIPGFKIYCYKGSAAEQYAIDNKIEYELLSDYEYSELEDGTLEITKYNGTDADVVIPGETEGKKVTSIGSGAFRSCNDVTSMTVPSAVKKIKDSAFASCAELTSVSLPDSVEYLGSEVFSNCGALESITVDENNSTFCSEDGVLYSKDKTVLIRCPEKKPKATVPDSVKVIKEDAFGGCSALGELTLPDSVETVEKNAFKDCTFKTVTVPRSVTTIGEHAFGYRSDGTSDDLKVSDFKIRCYKDTAAEKYAADNGFDCELIEDNLVGNLSIRTSNDADLSETVITAIDEDGRVFNIAFTPDGKFTADLPDGKYTVTVKKKGYPARRAEIEVGGEKPAELDVQLYQYGDGNHDGNFNMKDIAIFQRDLNGWDVEFDETVVDFNGDSRKNMKDLVTMQRLLNGWDVDLA